MFKLCCFALILFCCRHGRVCSTRNRYTWPDHVQQVPVTLPVTWNQALLFCFPPEAGTNLYFYRLIPPNMPPPPLVGRQTANLITLFTGLTFFWYLANCCVYCNYWLLVRVNHYNRAIFYFQFQTFPSCCTRTGCLRGFHNESQWKDALNLKILHRLVQG